MAKYKSLNKGRSGSTRRFAGIPHDVMDHKDYRNLSGGAVKLLLELTRQYNGRNNGDLTLAFSVLKKRGFGSKSTLAINTKKLLEANLIIRARDGSFSKDGGCCALYALTWQPINELPEKRLDVMPTTAPPRKFSMENNKSSSPETGPVPSLKQGRSRPRDGQGRYLPSLK